MSFFRLSELRNKVESFISSETTLQEPSSDKTVDGTLLVTGDAVFGVETMPSPRSKFIFTNGAAPRQGDEDCVQIITDGGVDDPHRVPLTVYQRTSQNQGSLQTWFSDFGRSSHTQATLESDGSLHVARNACTTSDARIIFDEQTLSDSLQTLMKVRPLQFRKGWIGNEKDGTESVYVAEDGSEMRTEMPVHSGLVAQEVFYDAPELRHLVRLPQGLDVNTVEEPPQNYYDAKQDPTLAVDWSAWGPAPASIEYTGFIPYLIKAVQELKELIESYKSENESLRTKLEDLETRVNNLESTAAS